MGRSEIKETSRTIKRFISFWVSVMGKNTEEEKLGITVSQPGCGVGVWLLNYLAASLGSKACLDPVVEKVSRRLDGRIHWNAPLVEAYHN